jgi:hypothetical protein
VLLISSPAINRPGLDDAIARGRHGLSADSRPSVTFTIRRGLSAVDKSRLSEAMLEAQVAAGHHRADRFHRFLEVYEDDLLVDPRFPDYAMDRTYRFMVVEVIISRGKPAGTAAAIADEAAQLFGEHLQLAPQDVPFIFHEVDPDPQRFPGASMWKIRSCNGDTLKARR